FFTNCLPLLSYKGTSSCGTYPSFTRRDFLHVPSGLCVAGINELPKIETFQMEYNIAIKF
ncbi:hypothetical protein NL500_29260, partial [Klebsiella pneumoniae]|nr:hypothetical protein [Klebsiella pneumoniae]